MLGERPVGAMRTLRGKLADINQYIQKQVAEAKLRYGMIKPEEIKDERVYKENFELMKDTPIEKYDPNRNVISDYTFKALKPKEDIPLDKVQVGMLESEKFVKPEDYTGEKEFSEYLEVDKYDAGSGDLSELNEAYKLTNKDNYYKSLKALRVRGGNVHVYPTEECDPTGKKNSIIGFL